MENFAAGYTANGWSRASVDALSGVTVLEFGTAWCPICQAAQPMIRAIVEEFPAVRHIKDEDGSGRPLGRSFRVKLWPTLIVLKDGVEIGRVVRPSHAGELRALMARVV
jgi:thioredoxin 1